MIQIKDCACGRRCRAGSDKCATCETQERKEARQATKVQIVRPVKKVTAKRAGQLQEYKILKREYLALYPICEVEDCNEKSVDVHHMATRTNDNLLNTDLFLAVCRFHHTEITTDSKWAKVHGYSVIRTKDVIK